MAGVQVRLATRCTSEFYVTAKLWLLATLVGCPWHPEGGCGFCRHGTYARVKPRGTLIARWYCPLERRTVSALPDCLASHYSGTLQELEAQVRAVERASSLASAAEHLRTDIELPGALRYLSRLCTAIHSALGIIRGLQPQLFCSVAPTLTAYSAVLGEGSVLMTLREKLSGYLAQLPTPLGFNPPRNTPARPPAGGQHPMGRDPPFAFVDPAAEPVADRQTEQPHR